MAVNKVEVNGETKLDLTQDSVTPENLLSGATAHNAAGEQIVGKYQSVALTGLEITALPEKTDYKAGETFDPAGMVVTATYSNGAKLDNPAYTVAPSGALAVGTTTVTITYSEGGITKTATQAISVTGTVLTVPTQSGTLTYTGGAQSPAWSNYDADKMTLGGVTSGTNAGSYNATFTIKNTALYCWPDGSTAAKTVAWTIGKAAGTLTLSKTEVTLKPDTTSDSFTVTTNSAGAVSVESSAPDTVAVRLDGDTVTVTSVGNKNGTAVITVSVAGDANHTAPAEKTCTVKAEFVPSFADETWEHIISACQSGNVPDTWAVGNSKAMTIGGKSYQVDIIGKNHDTYANGGTAPLTFQLHDCYGTKYAMNSSSTNSGGWTSCDMRQTHLPAILSQMPTEVQNGIREVNKMTSAGNKSATINTTADKLFLLSEIEIFGSIRYSKAGEGTQYDYYKAGNSRVKNYDGRANYWLERSPHGSDSTEFCAVLSNGNADYNSANFRLGVAFGFCF